MHKITRATKQQSLLVDPVEQFVQNYYEEIQSGHFVKHLFDEFKKAVWLFYKTNKRDFLWRNTTNPYHIVVSEIMLQQTQTKRVEEKFSEFIIAFPTINDLALAPFNQVLSLWVGLGYNRRAQALHGIAQRVVHEYNGVIPNEVETLMTFKGLGPATASSIVAFAFNHPTVFIETNIRTVFLHIFFRDQSDISDQDLMPLIETTVDVDNPREWYYALMDYGVTLKKLHKNPNRKSKHYTQQSRFEGSDRQIRGAILKYLVEYKEASQDHLVSTFAFDKRRVLSILKDLEDENFLVINQEKIYLID